MITATFEPVYDNNNTLIKNLLTFRFNGKYINSVEFPPETTMTEDDINNYVAAKLSGLLS